MNDENIDKLITLSHKCVLIRVVYKRKWDKRNEKQSLDC